MGRVIKFRAWDKANRWIDEGIFIRADGTIYTDGVIAYDTPNTEIEEVKESDFVIMQFTGLTDRNGKEIYEGDIVNLYSGRCKAVVEFKFGCFVVSYSGTEETIYENLDDIEVIGNIYENSDLLEGVK